MDQDKKNRMMAALDALAELMDTKSKQRRERKMLSFINRLRKQGFTITDYVIAAPVVLTGKLPNGKEFYFRCRYQACRLIIGEMTIEQTTKLDGTLFERWEAGHLTAHQTARMLTHLLGQAGHADAQRQVRAATA